MSSYDDVLNNVCKSKLKLKKDPSASKKKKKKDKEEKELKEKLNTSADEIAKQSAGNTNTLQLTKAQIAFQKQQEKIQKERILQKASMTHKQRVEEFNRHLDSLTEHFDIPKVSWTK
ncbi:protein FAM32A-like [Diaphorina citri]|uniref:Protein FAM32A-like n=1 Tax=Diaphorina citri TaxID=121845 RepID=A0A1S3CXM3_DIACI|nr:protein FAM32A-like [Diaphorina citri]